MLVYVNLVMLGLSVGLMFAFYIIFGALFSSFIVAIFKSTEETIFGSDHFSMILLAAFIFVFCFKREIKELEFLANLLVIACFLFLLSLISQFSVSRTDYNPDESYLDYFKFKITRYTVTCFSVFVVAFNL